MVGRYNTYLSVHHLKLIPLGHVTDKERLRTVQESVGGNLKCWAMKTKSPNFNVVSPISDTLEEYVSTQGLVNASDNLGNTRETYLKVGDETPLPINGKQT